MKKKVLVFAHEKSMNGASHSLYAILKSLDTVYDFFVIVPQKGMFTEQLGTINVKYAVLEIPRSGLFHKVSTKDYLIRRLLYYKTTSQQVKNVLDVICNFKPEVVYTNTSVLNIGFYTARKLNIPHIWHIREYGNLDFNINYFPSLSYTRNLMRKSDAIIFTTSLLKNHWFPNKIRNSHIVHNGYHSKHVETNKNLFSENIIKIGLIGYFNPAKGQKEAVKILDNLVKNGIEANLYFFGEVNETSNYFKEIIMMIDAKDLSQNVFFCGYKKQEEIYGDIDLLLCCSAFEAFGRTVIEAMSYGIPVIAKNSGGPKEIITHLEDGFLYNTIEEAAAYIISCIDNTDQYQLISNMAVKKIRNQFSMLKYITSMKEIFKNA